jgi:hypothetical protein
MKPIFTRIVFFLTLTVLYQAASAQTVTTNPETWAALMGSGTATCNNCTITIPAGYTLLLNSAGTCDGCTFNGGTVNISNSFTFQNNATNFNNDTVLVGVSTSFYSVDFSSDSVAINASLTSQNGTATIANSRVFVNTSSAVTLNEGTFTNDSLHLNSNLTINNPTDNFTGDHVDVATGVTISSQGASYTNSVFSFAGTSKLTDNNALTTSGTSIYMAGTASISASTISMTNGVLDLGGTNSVSGQNGLTFTGTTVAMAGSSTMTTSGNATFQTGATLSMYVTSSLSVNNSLTVSGSDVYLYGNASVTDNPATIENGSYLQIGNGTLDSTAHMYSQNTLTVDNTSTLAIANNNNYLRLSVSQFAGGSTSYTVGTNTISCGGGGNEHACQTDYIYGCATLNKSGAVGCVTLALADISLTAVPAGANAVNLSWSDGQSATADHYMVQRSTDNSDWTNLATVAAGSYTVGDYQFEDPAAPAGTDNYRIARVDQDGAFLYSAISSVTIAPATAGDIRLYPNPATGHTFFIRVPDTEQVTISVFTVTGQLLLRQSLQGQTQYQVLLPSQLLPGNAVIVQAISRASTQAFPLLLQ